MRRQVALARIATVCVVAGLIGVGSVGQAAAADLPEGTFTISNVATGNCLAVASKSSVKFTECDVSDKNQQWTSKTLSKGVALRNGKEGGCLRFIYNQGQTNDDDGHFGLEPECGYGTVGFIVEDAPGGAVRFKESRRPDSEDPDNDDSPDEITFMAEGDGGDTGSLIRGEKADAKNAQWKVTTTAA